MESTGSQDVIVVGELNMDLILDGLKEKMPELGKEILSESMHLTMGSSSAILACNLSKLGAKVAFIGLLGEDDFGYIIRDSLEEAGVDTSGIMSSKESDTGITVALSYGNERAMVTHAGAMEHLGVEDISSIHLRKGRHLHLSSVFLQKKLRPDVVELFTRAKKAGLTTSLDPQWDPEEKWDLDLVSLLPVVDVFLPNSEEIRHLTGTSSLDQAITSISGYANTVVIKDGVNGARLWSKGRILEQPAFLNPEVVDTIGAGDSFNAGFIFRYIKGSPLVECLEYAALTGAINTTRPGGTMAFKDPAVTAQIARELFQMEIK
jgi:sugar/nucleoside kinase (ribokinase family)